MVELRLACSLQPEAQTKRADLGRSITERWLTGWQATGRGAEMTFATGAEAELRELIAAESQCCAFLEFDLRSAGPELELDVTGPEGAQPIILALFGLESGS